VVTFSSVRIYIFNGYLHMNPAAFQIKKLGMKNNSVSDNEMLSVINTKELHSEREIWRSTRLFYCWILVSCTIISYNF